ncbi:hypothetical protein N9M41_01940 [Rhodopirellula sp.]|nr:hypothetical protein [Rhodopirellula sp.]
MPKGIRDAIAEVAVVFTGFYGHFAWFVVSVRLLDVRIDGEFFGRERQLAQTDCSGGESNVAWHENGWREKPEKLSVFGGQEPLTNTQWGRKFSSLLQQRVAAESKDSPRIGLVRHLRSYVECRS